MSGPLRTLLVDDDHEDARLFRRHAPARFEVDHCTTAAAALRALEQHRYDVCFVDYRLGADSGLDLVRELRRAGHGVAVIVVTGQDVETLGENALLAGATDFIQKDGLSATRLERAARWALIRRHVEQRAQDEASAAALAQALERARQPDRADPVRRLVYLSQARASLGPPELLALCGRFASANARIDVTGVLLAAGDRFLQVLEGPDPAVGALMDRIAADTRHGNIAVVMDERAAARLYGGWNMGYLALQERFGPDSQAWLALTREAGRELSAVAGNRAALDGFITRLPRLLRGAAA